MQSLHALMYFDALTMFSEVQIILLASLIKKSKEDMSLMYSLSCIDYMFLQKKNAGSKKIYPFEV